MEENIAWIPSWVTAWVWYALSLASAEGLKQWTG